MSLLWWESTSDDGMDVWRVLTKDKRPMGYIDVTALKQKFEAGNADPVRNSVTAWSQLHFTDRTSQFLERLCRIAHDQVQTSTIATVYCDHSSYLLIRTGILSQFKYFRVEYVLIVYLASTTSPPTYKSTVTDADRKFVLALATKQDLDVSSCCRRSSTINSRLHRILFDEEAGSSVPLLNMAISRSPLLQEPRMYVDYDLVMRILNGNSVEFDNPNSQLASWLSIHVQDYRISVWTILAT